MWASNNDGSNNDNDNNNSSSNNTNSQQLKLGYTLVSFLVPPALGNGLDRSAGAVAGEGAGRELIGTGVGFTVFNGSVGFSGTENQGNGIKQKSIKSMCGVDTVL